MSSSNESKIDIQKLNSVPSAPIMPNPMLGDVFSPCIEVADNLEFMHSIESNTIDLIYCDVLYGTGRNFGDYQDLKPIKSEIESHYIPRIKEMHRILKDTGSIYLQMDCKVSHWLRIICDDIFGYNNFRNKIVWCYTSPSNSLNNYPKKFDEILYYSKSNNYTFNIQYIPYKKINAGGTNYGKGLNGNHKSYLEKGKKVENFWVDICPIERLILENSKYPTQKPKKLIERIVKTSSNKNDLVGDFYLGSGTTAVVCKELSRRFVGCDINPNAVKLTNERLNGTLF